MIMLMIPFINVNMSCLCQCIDILGTLTSSAGAGEEVDGGDGPENGHQEEQQEDGDDEGRVQV